MASNESLLSNVLESLKKSQNKMLFESLANF